MALHAGLKGRELVRIPRLDPIDERHRVFPPAVQLLLGDEDVFLEVRDEHGNAGNVRRSEGLRHGHTQAARQTVEAPLHLHVARPARNQKAVRSDAEDALSVEQVRQLQEAAFAHRLDALLHDRRAAHGDDARVLARRACSFGAGRGGGRGVGRADAEGLPARGVAGTLVLLVHVVDDTVPHGREERGEVLGPGVPHRTAARRESEDLLRETFGDLRGGALAREPLPLLEDARHTEDRAAGLVPYARVRHEQEEAHGPQQQPQEHIRPPRCTAPELLDLGDGLPPRRGQVQSHSLLQDGAENHHRHEHLHA
mmetsp:Transcript_118041/g.341266  ORF Transcript_118041/g.341266 Transcript_118041/m.341266 type:complete len:311 (-) Transcript_118041:930-1862(-)